MSIKLHNLDCTLGLIDVPNDSISCIITSPPYKDSDNFTFELMESWLGHAFRVLKNNSILFLNFGHLANFKSRPFKVVLLAESLGFKLNDTIVWSKNHYRPIQGNKRVNNLTEFIFVLTKGSPCLNRLSIGVPYADKSNVGRFSDIDLKCRGNVWEIKYKTIQSVDFKRHNDRFPIQLPLMCIKLADLSFDDIVLDPFNGSGTTGIACLFSNVNYVGFEINSIHYNNSLNWFSLVGDSL